MHKHQSIYLSNETVCINTQSESSLKNMIFRLKTSISTLVSLCVCAFAHRETEHIELQCSVHRSHTVYTQFFVFAFVLVDRRVAISHLDTKSMHVRHFKSMFERSCHNTIYIYNLQFVIRIDVNTFAGKAATENAIERLSERVSKRIRTKSTMSLERLCERLLRRGGWARYYTIYC